MTLEIETAIEAEGWSETFDPDDLARICIKAAAKGREFARSPTCEICVIFTGDVAMRELNSHWRKIDKPTNVLSFPAPAAPAKAPVQALGDVFLALETVQREAGEQGKSFRDHTAHLIVHGFLHLIGYDHENETEAVVMEGEETVILAGLGIGNPYEGDWRPESAG